MMLTPIKSPNLRPIYTIGLATLLFFSLSILSDRFMRGVWIDLTANNLYTLSPGTKETLQTQMGQMAGQQMAAQNGTAPVGGEGGVPPQQQAA